jgi:hypothetical protein
VTGLPAEQRMERAVMQAVHELVDAESLVQELATGWPVGVVTTGASMATGMDEDLRARVWLQQRQVVTYEVQPGQVVEHLLRWVDDYRAGRGWA